VDVRPDTYNIDPDGVAVALTEKTKAVMAVHLFGLCAEMNALRAVLPENVTIIEDAACAAGATYQGAPPGTLGQVACFSFHPRKSISTGEGGMLITNDGALAARAEALRNHGATPSPEAEREGPAPYRMPDFNLLGYNYRMSDLQAAVGLVQLRKLDGFIDERNQWADRYHEALADLSWLILPRAGEDCRHAWQAYVTVVDQTRAPIPRNAIMDTLQARGIGTRPGTHAVTSLGYYRHVHGVDPARYPVASHVDRCSMAIPLHNRMSEEDFVYVADALHHV